MLRATIVSVHESMYVSASGEWGGGAEGAEALICHGTVCWLLISLSDAHTIY